MEEENESGFIIAPEDEFGMYNGLTDIEILREGSVNIIAVGHRYGRRWLLKGLRAELRDSWAHRRRVQKEFEIQSRFRSPAVARVVGMEEVDGLGSCIVQEWIEGSDLHTLLKQGQLSRKERRRIMLDIVRAVADIHSKGVVHRDLKPGNIMISSADGSVVLVDFGLADTYDYVELKRPGGTPGFISPEQADRKGGDPSDDVYSLGVIMKELDTGFHRLASRCISPQGRRPRDARMLLLMWDRRVRVQRIAAMMAVILFVGLAVSLTSQRVSSHIALLKEKTRQSEMRIAELEHGNNLDRKKIIKLGDSLQQVSGRMHTAEEELRTKQRQDALKATWLRKGRLGVDGIYQRIDKRIALLGPDDKPLFQQNMESKNEEFDIFLRQFRTSLKASSLTSAEQETVAIDVYNYYLQLGQSYQKKWLKRIFPDYYK